MSVVDDAIKGVEKAVTDPFGGYPTKDNPNPGSPQVTVKQAHLSQIAHYGGWSQGAEVKLACAVAMGESRGNPNAVNSIPCVGLWQINVQAHAGSMGIPANHDDAIKWLKNPWNNARVAYTLWKSAGGTFARDWEAYQNGSYLRFMGQDPLVPLNGAMPTSSFPSDVASVADAVTKPFDIAGDIWGALTNPDTWLRVGKGALGLVVVVVGVVAIVLVAKED